MMKAYETEVRKRWGDTDAYKEHSEKTKNYEKDKWNALADEMDAIFGGFAVCMRSGIAPDGEEPQSLVKKLQVHITENYYNCTNPILAGLGMMYVGDERFKNNIDKHGDGTAQFICDAITIYCSK